MWGCESFLRAQVELNQMSDESSSSDHQSHQGGVWVRWLLVLYASPELKTRKTGVFVQIVPICNDRFPICVEGGHVLCTAVLHVFNEGVETVNQTHQAWHVG